MLWDLSLVRGNSRRIIIMQLVISRMSGNRQRATHSLYTLSAPHLHSMPTNAGTGKVPNVLRFWKHHSKPGSQKASMCLAFRVAFQPPKKNHHPLHMLRLTLGWMIKALLWKTLPSLDPHQHHLPSLGIILSP